jgi:hypothetical protein
MSSMVGSNEQEVKGDGRGVAEVPRKTVEDEQTVKKTAEEHAEDGNSGSAELEESSDTENGAPGELWEPLGMSPCEIIRNAAKDAAEYHDYISYATVLDEVMSDPSKYTDQQRQEILETLAEVIESDDQLVYEVGWDLPLPLLGYVESSYNFAEGLGTSVHIKLVMRIFSALSEKGNPKELFLKGCEGLAKLQLSPEEEDVQDQEVRERYGDMKFYLLFELMFFSLRRIEAQYPSRFLSTAITVLLSFVASNLEHLKLLSLGVVLRRLFTFGRDYQTAPSSKEIPESENWIQQKLMQSYLTWVADLCFHRFSVRWSQRLFHELKAGVALSDPNIRSKVYHLNMHTERVTECVERLSQLTYSFDMDVLECLRDLVNKDTHDLDQESTASRFSNLSDEGILLLGTQLRFDYRVTGDKDMTFADLVKLTERFLQPEDGEKAGLGVQDALCFWGLWITRDISAEDVQKVSQEDFTGYLQQLMVLSATSYDKESRFLTYSLAAKLLRLHRPEIAFDYIVDTLRYCPFENVKDAVVRILKTLVLEGSEKPVRKDSVVGTVEGVAADLNALSLEPRIPLGSDKRQIVQDLIDRVIEVIQEEGVLSESLPVMLSWLNFVTVVELDKRFVDKFVAAVEEILETSKKSEGNREARQQREGLLSLSIESVKKKWS